MLLKVINMLSIVIILSNNLNFRLIDLKNKPDVSLLCI